MQKRNQILSVFKKAKKAHYPIFQFNFSTIEQFQGIIKGAKCFTLPIILGTSEGESKFLGLDLAVKMKEVAEKELGKGKVFLNLDHGKSFEIVKKAIKEGYDMVHFDGGSIPFEKNIEITKNIVNLARKNDVIVEGEVGFIEQSSEIHKGEPQLKLESLTNPDEAKEFVQKTGIDNLAIAIGNVHGIYQGIKVPKLDVERLSMIQNKVGEKAFLVLHGGSGIPIGELKKAIKEGVVKININTETRIVWRKTLEKSLKENPNEITPYKLMNEVVEAIQKTVEKKLKPFYK
ncbi:MAG TPA: ketose-bisphosphate aldolase [Candidatus Pacearchaeota archaeon]|mgnify:CR=1 FL=1|nr:ketose-bisphosphate aldolase [Candidatus Pacearchaeota archaeon]HOK94268.1 ketose-bisphosphate aldolase [Candidatus Pacearchaeota archaeon]HPO75382.1 ketose-bisphosphate aldolase [Candidatus Pacearchaeota archaeon]